MTLIEKVTISGYRSARDVALVPGAACVLVGESSSGKSTVLSAIWTLLEAAAPMPTGENVSRGHTRVHIEASAGNRTLFLDARPPATINLNREGAPEGRPGADSSDNRNTSSWRGAAPRRSSCSGTACPCLRSEEIPCTLTPPGST